MKRILFLLFYLFIFFPFSILLAQDNGIQNLREYFEQYTNPNFPNLKKITVEDIQTDAAAKKMTIVLSDNFIAQPVTPLVVGDLYNEVKRLLPMPFNTYNISIVSAGSPIEQLIPTSMLDRADTSRVYKRELFKGNPWVTPMSHPYSIKKGLQGRHLGICHSHGKYFSFEDYRKAVEPAQTDKDKNVVYLYATDAEAQYAQIEAAKNKGYDVLLMDCELDAHFVNLLEGKLKDTRFARVDSDAVDNLIAKQDKVTPEMAEDDKRALEEIFKAVLPKEGEYTVEPENLGETAAPVLITQSEFMRRYRDMSALGGGLNFYGQMPRSYNIKVNMENPLIHKIWDAHKEAADTSAADFASGSELLHQVVDLALLANGMLKGKALSEFIERSQELLK